jgi:hypothetical protein
MSEFVNYNKRDVGGFTGSGPPEMQKRDPDEARRLVAGASGSGSICKPCGRSGASSFSLKSLFSGFVQCPPLSLREQETLAKHLFEMKPRGTGELIGLIRGSLAGWNASVEQLPFYFRDTYGSKEVELALNSLDSETGLSESEREAMRAFRYWLGIRNRS